MNVSRGAQLGLASPPRLPARSARDYVGLAVGLKVTDLDNRQDDGGVGLRDHLVNSMPMIELTR